MEGKKIMNREEILKQIMALPEKSRLLVGFNEMAKDLEGILKDDEVIEGVAAAYEKNITHLVKNGKMMRSFMAITNKNVYLLSRGRMILNNVSLMNKTIVIPRNQILKINRKELPAVLKILYDAEVDIMTDTEQYEIYMGAGFEKYLPQSFLSKITTEHVLEKVVSEKKCPNCGQEVAAEANFCKRCNRNSKGRRKKESLCAMWI